MWRPYLKVIQRKAGHTLHVLDRFHIVATLNKAIDTVRASEARHMKEAGYEPILKGSCWLLLSRPEHLSTTRRGRLKELLQCNLKTVRAYLLKEEFQLFWEYVSPYWAGRFIDRWCETVMRSRIEPMKKVAGMVQRHRELLLNWFKAKKTISAGVVEGMNNKAKLCTKKAYGYSTLEMLQVSLYHTLGDLPEPKFTHRFF
jgi:transposase